MIVSQQHKQFQLVGQLTKLGGHTKNWLPRHFALDVNGRTLYYFRTEAELQHFATNQFSAPHVRNKRIVSDVPTCEFPFANEPSK